MKKSLLLALIAILFLPSIVSAESAENVTKRRPDNPAKIEVQEIRQERQENREDIKAKGQEMRSNVAENHALRLEKRFQFYYERLSNIIARFQTRLDLMKKEGKDVSSIQTKLDTAKAKLELAKSKGDSAIAAFKAIDPAKFSEQKSAAFAARDMANASRKLFDETHTLLKDALKSLKLISKEGAL